MLPLITPTFILNLVIFASFPLSSNSQELYQALAGNYILDLLPIGIVEAVKAWQINGVTLTDTSKLSDYYGSGYLGGPGKLISGDTLKRTYTSLPSHNMVSFWLYINLLDDWTPGGTITIYIDQQPRFSFTPQTIIQTQSFGSFGGSPSPDALRTMIGRFYHSGQSLTFAMVSTPSNPLASFGINYVKMMLLDVPAVGTTEMFCIHENVPGTNAFSGACRCDLGHYFDSNTNSCRSCDSSCAGCFGPTKANCFACADSYTYQTDLGYCSPLASDCLLGVGGQENQCYMCQPGYYLYWNHTCQLNCPSFLVSAASGLKVCQTPCTASGTYALQDYTCATSCNAPMQVRIEDDSKFCDSPCPDSILSWDGSCLTTCHSPYTLRTYGGNNFCDACHTSTDYMYPDSTCQPSCSSPYIHQSMGGSNFCLYPCQDGGYYNDETSQCQAVCEYPYKVQDNVFCVLDLSPQLAHQMERIASAAGVTETTGTALGASVTLINFGNPTAIFVNAFADMISKLKYLNIGYPAKLILFFGNSVKTPFFGVPEHVVEKMSKSSLSGTFKRYNTYSSFLVNLWQPIILLSIIVTVLGFVCVMCMVTVRYKRVHSICLKIRTVLKWNFSLTFFTSYFGDIVLYSSFEVEYADLKSVDSIASFILCFIFNLMVFISFFKMLKVVASQHFSEIRQKIKSVLREDKEQEEFDAVLKNFKSTTFIQQGFFFIFMARIYIFAVVIAYLYNYPLAQAITVLLLSFVMLLYLALLRPLKSKVDLGQYIMQEIVMLIITTCVLILGIFDKAGAQNFEARKTLGDIILGSNMALKAIGLVYLGIRTSITLFVVIKAAIQSSKGQKDVKSQIIEQPEITVSNNETSKPTLEFPEKVKVSISSPKGTNLRVVDLNASKRPKQSSEDLATPQMSKRAKIEFVRPIFNPEAGIIESDLSFNNDSGQMLQPNMHLENPETSENYESDLKKLIAESHKSYSILANSLKKSS